MNDPYVMERYAREKHGDRVHKSTTVEQVAASRRSSAVRRPPLARRLMVTMLTALASLAREKR